MSMAQKITEAFQLVGSDIKDLAEAVAQKLSKASDTVTGKLIVNHLQTKVMTHKTRVLEDVSGLVNLDIGSYTRFEVTTTGDIALNITNAPTLVDETMVFTVMIFAPGSAALQITFFSTIFWMTELNNEPNDLDPGQIIELEFTSKNGTLFYGRVKSRG